MIRERLRAVTAALLLAGSLLWGGTVRAQGPLVPRPAAIQIAGQGALNAAVDRQLALIESQAQLSQAMGEPAPGYFAAINRLRDMLPRSARTRRMQAQGEMLRSLCPLGIVNDQTAAALSDIDTQAQQDSVYQQALLTVDARLFPKGAARNDVPHALAASSGPFPYAQLRPGDVMLWDNRGGGRLSVIGDFFYAHPFTHAALYLGTYGIDGSTTGVRRTYEAETRTSGVISDAFDGRWDQRGIHVALGHVRNVSLIQGLTTVIRAYRQFGDGGHTPYHLIPPWNEDYLAHGLYCSQLVWVPYKQSGVDLDSNDWRYATWFVLHNWWVPFAAQIAYYTVFPDELRASTAIDWYYDQVNP